MLSENFSLMKFPILLRIKNSNPAITSIPNLIIKEFAQIQKNLSEVLYAIIISLRV